MASEHLFSPLTIRGLTLRNRIFSTGHQTNMVEGGAPSARMAAYHEARAAGGAGLIIIEAARMHDTALSDGLVLDIRGGWGGASARYLNLVNTRIPVMSTRRRRGEAMEALDTQWRKPCAIWEAFK